MAGIIHLTDIYRAKGRDFIDKLFDNYVTINEKIDGSAFAVERNQTTKQLEYYKRSNDLPISMIDRTLARFYEQPISHFESMDPSVIGKMPLGWRFGFEYLVDNGHQAIAYDRAPKNNLILSYIHVRNLSGKIVRTVQDKAELDKWADTLGVERSPIIFQGVLTNDQKIKILEFMDTHKDDMYSKFKTQSFVRFVISVLNPKLKKTFLNDDADAPIEGIVFRFGTDDKVTLAKLVDPVFHELIKTKGDREAGSNNDVYQIALLDIMNYVDGINLNKFKPKGKTYDERYINFVCSVFNKFVEEKGDEYETVDFDEPAYLKRDEFDLNTDFIKDVVTLSNIDRSTALKKLFKIMLASFKKRRRKVVGIFTKEVINQFNLTVDNINAHLSAGAQPLKESVLPLFSEFMDQRGSDRVEDEIEDEEEEDLPIFTDDDVLDIDTLSDAVSDEDQADSDEDKPSKKKKTGKKVNIIVGRFQPFHNGHLEMIEELYVANKRPVVLVAVHPGHNKSGMSPFSISTVRTMLGNIKAESKGKVCDYRVIGRGFIGDIIAAVRPEYEPVIWGVGPDRVDGYTKQLELNYKKKNELGLLDDFTIMETNRYMKGSDVRKCVEDDRFGAFKDMVPKSVQSMYTLLRNDILREEDDKDN